MTGQKAKQTAVNPHFQLFHQLSVIVADGLTKNREVSLSTPSAGKPAVQHNR